VDWPGWYKECCRDSKGWAFGPRLCRQGKIGTATRRFAEVSSIRRKNDEKTSVKEAGEVVGPWSC
jgi:hypothetical protein